jgi:hypothetical protein
LVAGAGDEAKQQWRGDEVDEIISGTEPRRDASAGQRIDQHRRGDRAAEGG